MNEISAAIAAYAETEDRSVAPKARQTLSSILAQVLDIPEDLLFITKLKPAGVHNNIWQGEGNSKRKIVHVLINLTGSDDLGSVVEQRLAPPLPNGFDAIVVGGVDDQNGQPTLLHVVQYQGGKSAQALKSVLPDIVVHEVPDPAAPQDVAGEVAFEPNAYPTARELLMHLQEARNLVLQGPPGTGKTLLAEQIANLLSNGVPLDSCRLSTLMGTGQETSIDPAALADLPLIWDLVQLHPSYSYDDFVRGLRTDPSATPFGMKPVDGLLARIARVAWARSAPTLLILDEINRGNLASILGETIFAIDPSHRGLPIRLQLAGGPDGLGRRLSIPENLLILGTMNTADRSIAMLDFAIRRRFRFVSIPASADALQSYYGGAGTHEAIKSAILLRAIQQLVPKPEICPGHSYLMVDGGVAGDHREWAERLMNKLYYELGPLLREYLDEGLINEAPVLQLPPDLRISLMEIPDAQSAALLQWLLAPESAGDGIHV